MSAEPAFSRSAAIKTLKRIILHPQAVLALYAMAVVVVVVQQTALGDFPPNFFTFREAFFRLAGGSDPYAPYPQFNDLFKYSPAFALFFAPFSVVPVAVGLLLWNGLNAIGLYAALTRVLPSRAARLAAAIVFFEVLGSIQNTQSNALLATTMLLAFIAFERDRPFLAALAVVGGAFVKIFPLAGLALAIFYPRKGRFAASVLLLTVLFAAIPLLVSSPAALARDYRSWLDILTHDDLVNHGMSALGFFRDSLGLSLPNLQVQFLATAALLAPFAFRRSLEATEEMRRTFACSLMVFVVIFNHQAESPSYVIALAGIAVWFASSPRTPARLALMAATLILVSLSTSDLVPDGIQDRWIRPYDLKAVPCLAGWLMMQFDLARAPAALEVPESELALAG